jgi:hypothetical protein
VTAPRAAYDGQVVTAAVGGSWSYLPANRWEFQVPGTAMGICRDPRQGYGGTFDDPNAGDGLECKFRVSAYGAIHKDPTSGNWIGGGDGWVKVGLYLLCGYGCNPYAEQDEVWMAVYTTPAPPPPPPSCPGTPPCIKHVAAQLEVKVEPKDPKITIEQTRDGEEAKKVEVKVSVKNLGAKAIDGVTLPKTLTIGADVPLNQLPAKPLKHVQEATPEGLGTIAPGATKSSTYVLEVYGDGKFDLEALVGGVRDGHNVFALGTGKLESLSQALVFTTAYGRTPKYSARANGAPSSLIKGGTSFTYRVTLKNRSWHKTIVVAPPYPELCGNAHDGRLVTLEPFDPIPAENDPGSLEAVEPASVIVLEPRESRELHAIVHTLTSPYLIGQDAAAPAGTSTCPKSGAKPSTGTQAFADFKPPQIATLAEDKSINDIQSLDDLKTALVTISDPEQVRGFQHDGSSWRRLADGEKASYRLSIDDRPAATVPYDNYKAAWAITKGLVLCAWNAGYGLVHGIFVDLPILAYKGITSLPGWVLKTMHYEASLWEEARKNPALMAALVDPIGNAMVHVYREFPGLAKNTAALYQQANALAAKHFNDLENELQAGDWQQALTTYTSDAGDIATLIVAPEVIAGKIAGPVIERIPKLREALELARLATARKVEAGLESLVRLRKVSARKALTALRTVVKPFYEFKGDDLRKMFGLSERESSFLRAFAKENKIIITLRSRASEAVDWLKKGAFLKPGWIKLKTVNFIDAEYLGYRYSDMGRLVIREPIAKDAAELEQLLLRKHGIAPGSPESQKIVSRFETRSKEWAGEVADMRRYDEQGYIEGKWDWQGNGVDPSYHADEKTKAHFRLFKDGHGNLIPQVRPGYRPNRRVRWKKPPAGSITGDVDFLDVRYADGRPLSDADHVRIFNELRLSEIGAEHPESATWIYKGQADFEAKHKFLSDMDSVAQIQANGGRGACCHVQFGPDEVARAVQYDMNESKFKSAHDYVVSWIGGYAYATP